MELSFEFKIILLLTFISTLWVFYTFYIVFVCLKLITIFQRKSIQANTTPFVKYIFITNKKQLSINILHLLKSCHYLNQEDILNYQEIKKKFKTYIGISLVFSLLFYFGGEYASQMEFLIR
jgi:hypothetical protein